ncbi:MAG TPA: glutathione S-transferase [Gammaproteobacteria bacterium]|jgi:glutathione S-transferase|nr:glutathione S-transferase [Acidiferrobacteraceae bacterium]MDP6397789.1 glutathione S-transferase family protein [Arenicellales bacterium]HCX88100.1 glutathione S-transferase [Gammaproteobacteria bacterium]MDP6552026.1 glutathione S-transferase family protein [Arenicellales bacterium]MDP6791900.1 glutathione S-transferase family protein [Arenicellales bacterium]|tara:strand:- start:357 stop:1004 length:648 start_codon:yes stop_codon:yes gene_type:complete
MTYQLFYAPGSAAMGTRVILEEIGAPYELIESTIDMDKPRLPEQLAINPNGWIPVLKWGDKAMYEGAAITVFLCDRHPDAGLAPAIDDPERGLYLQTLVYFSSSVQNAFQLDYYPDRFADTPDDEPSAQRRGARRLRETWKVIDDQIGSNFWVLGERFSAVDIYLFMLTTWLRPSRGHPTIDEFPNVKRIAEAVLPRDSIQLVYRDWIAGDNYGY